MFLFSEILLLQDEIEILESISTISQPKNTPMNTSMSSTYNSPRTYNMANIPMVSIPGMAFSPMPEFSNNDRIRQGESSRNLTDSNINLKNLLVSLVYDKISKKDVKN